MTSVQQVDDVVHSVCTFFFKIKNLELKPPAISLKQCNYHLPLLLQKTSSWFKCRKLKCHDFSALADQSRR